MKSASKKMLLGLEIILLLGLLAVILLESSSSVNIIGKIINPRVQEEAYFSMAIVIPYESKKIKQDSDVLINIKVVKLGNTERIDVALETYAIGPKNFILEKSLETFAIDTQTNIVKSIHIPNNAPLGDYTFTAKILYNDEEKSSASAQFLVADKNNSLFNFIFIGTSITITLLILIFFFLITIYKKVTVNAEKIKKISRK